MNASTLRQRPIFGGVFGQGRYALASVPCVARGLHAVRYMVVEPRAGAVLSVAEEKTEALSAARRLIQATEALRQQDAEDATPQPHQERLWPDDVLPSQVESVPVVQQASRRRREIFERAGGKCRYCGVTLQLNGKWHIEHMMPRALGGDDDDCNLTAACVPCNLSKRDSTALEFVSRQSDPH